jgi:alkylation response protein AidB-like acyl-CoA dehydrogenase
MQRLLDDVDRLVADHLRSESDRSPFLEAQFDLGLAWVHFRSGDGGRGLPPDTRADIFRTLLSAGAPVAFHLNPIGIGMIAPTIHDHGFEEQGRRWLRPLFSGREIWCQMFSEPGAGSDLAGVATSARRDGDTWMLNGQKVWTSLALVARWGFLLGRTDPEHPSTGG